VQIVSISANDTTPTKVANLVKRHDREQGKLMTPAMHKVVKDALLAAVGPTGKTKAKTLTANVNLTYDEDTDAVHQLTVAVILPQPTDPTRQLNIRNMAQPTP
jgi:formiminotetrahydrofolate cyclodeaminase